MPTTRSQPTIEEERAANLIAMGFDATQAFLLAATRAEGRYTAPDEVREALRQGCSHATAVRIFL